MTPEQTQIVKAAKSAARKLDQSNVLLKTAYFTKVEGKGTVETYYDGSAGVRLWVTNRSDQDGNLQTQEAIYDQTRSQAEASHVYAIEHFEDGWK